MRYVFVDFEMNPINWKYTEQRKQYFQEIIEIGAVMLDENLNEVSFFKKFVKPKYSKSVTPTIHKLTGIPNNIIKVAKPIEVVFENFIKWCVGMSRGEFIIYSWSDSDLETIINEIAMKEIPLSSNLIKVITSWHDLQLEFDKAIGSKNSTGLNRAVKSLAMDFEGDLHEALNDSRKAAAIYRELQDPEQMVATINEIRGYYANEHMNIITLGELIDFSAFNLGV